MSIGEYSIVPEHESGIDDREESFRKSIKIQRTWIRLGLLLSLTCLASLTLNLFLTYRFYSISQQAKSLSPYVYLPRDVPTEIVKNSTYSHPDRNVEDAAWSSITVRAENGAVALDDSFTKAVGLPHAMRWPWDQHKGVYEILSSHEMHCLHVLRTAINEAHDNLSVSIPHPHVMHCLDLLRETVMCNADDTLLYTGALHTEAYETQPSAGIGTVRMCRDWDKLQAWGREHSACYQGHFTDPSIVDEESRYKFCPDGSAPWKGLDGKITK